MDNRRVITVSELTKNIRSILEQNFSSLWIEGEISNFLLHSSGHMYFSLKDKDSLLSAVLFRNANRDLKFEMKDGLQVIAFGRISVYDKRGQYQLIIDRLEPKGIGALQLAFEQLKSKLEKEGLFDASRKKELPFLPSRIGVVTSPTGAAIKDIINITTRRFPGVEMILMPVKVQGEGAKEEIARAIDIFNELKLVDVMIVGRGGGSLEDLWAFNEEIVVRAIARSEIPVVSAVGHEIDWTISDFAADLRAPTPSGAAELVVPRREDLLADIDTSCTRLKNSLVNLVGQAEQAVDEALGSLTMAEQHIYGTNNEYFKSVVGKMEALSPLAVLRRGYSITRTEDKHVIKNSGGVKKGDSMVTIFSEGKVLSVVEKILS